MKLYLISIVLLISNCNNSISNTKKDFDILMEELVLKNGQIGLEIFTKLKNEKYLTEYQMIYIGQILNSKNDSLYFLYRLNYSGYINSKGNVDSKHSLARIVIYKNFERLGSYYVGGGGFKIPYINNKALVLRYDDNDKCKLETKINFFDSIPQSIYIKCNESKDIFHGDLYTFENEK